MNRLPKCLVRGVPCEKDSCDECPGELQRFRGAALIESFRPALVLQFSDEERRHKENVRAQLSIAEAQFRMADAQRSIANQVYWDRRYRAAGK